MYNAPTGPGNDGGRTDDSTSHPTENLPTTGSGAFDVDVRNSEINDSNYTSTVPLNYQTAGQTVPTDIASSGINNLVTNQLSQSTYDPATKTWKSTDLPKNIKAAGNIFGVTEDANQVKKLVTQDPNAKFAGNTFTNYNSYYFNNKDGTTTIVVPGKNGGTSETYKICDTKVYAQTLFLGASVLSFNASLAWGAESSRLTVELAVDSCKYPVFKDAKGQDVVRPTGNAALNDYNNKRFLKDKKGFQKNENGHSIIPGKVYYRPYNGVFQSDYWYDEDPGFYADIGAYSIDIIGMAARFCYDDFEFSGIITSWEKKSGESAAGLYTVTLESPSQLLKNVGVILDDYSGSVHQNVENHSVYKNYKSDPGDDAGRVGFPSMLGSNDKNYGGLIRNQSIPNLVNVYGFLEDGGYGSSTNFGGSLRNKNGIPAYMVTSALTYLLDRPGIYFNDGTQNQQNAWRIFRYSPYGRIVGPHPQYKNSPHRTPTIDFTDPNIKPNFFKMGLVLFPRQNLKFNNEDYTTLVPYSLDLNDFFFNGYSVFTPEYRFDSKSGDVLSLLQTAAEAHGYDMFVHMYMVPDSEYMYPRIKVNLVTKNITPQEGIVKQFIDYAVNNGINVTGANVGEEFNGTEAVRTILIGGKQKRLYQTKFVKYATQQNTLRWNPYTQTFLNTTSPDTNTKDMRFADTTNPRNSNLGYGHPLRVPSNNIVDILGRVDRYEPNYLHTKDAWGGFAYRMNYFEPVIIPGSIGPVPPVFPASSAGQICPYFGIDPFTNMAREVEYNDYYGQFFVSINGLEFAKLVNFSVPGFVQVSETEIRAAMKGFDSLMGYLNGLNRALYPWAHTHKFDLYNMILRPLLTSPMNPGGHMPNGLNAGPVYHNKLTNKTTGMDSVPVAASSNFLNDPVLTNKLNRVQLFLQELGNQYYGKQFMVAIPRPMYHIDYNQHFSAVGNLPDGTLYSSLNGTKEITTAFTPTDSAWEEAGTTIDDSIMVGTVGANMFTNDDGTINPILGYNASFKINDNRLQESLLASGFFKNSIGANAFFYNWKKWDLARRAGNYNDIDPFNSYWEPSIIVAESKYSFVDYPSVIPDPFPDALNAFSRRYPPPGYAFKAYLAATVEPDYVWAPSRASDGRALKMIVKTGGAYLSPNSLNDLSVHSAIADYVRTFWPMAPNTHPVSNRLDNILSGSAAYLQYNHGYDSENLGKIDTSNKPNQNLSIAPKAAMPAFAAIPFESNTDIYGPWISSPDMYRYSIFPYYNDNIPSDVEGRQNKMENLIGGTKVINEADLVPWNFGGMINLDMHALLRVNTDNSYQQKGETGQLTYFGTPFFNLASELKAASNTFRGPIINNVQTQISSTGPTTTYTFRTYTKKFALFNKENADRLRAQGQESFKRTREIRARFESLKEDLYALSRTQMIFPNYDLTLSKLRSSSPSNILVAGNKPYVSPAAFWNPGVFGSVKDSFNLYWTTESSLQRPNVSLYNVGELAQEFEEDYANKAFMSLDGLFSPVSFYPTMYGGTAPFKGYYQSGCPNCLGTKRVWDDTLPAEQGSGRGRWVLCQMCSFDIAGTEECTKHDTLPPFVLSNVSDSDMYYGGNGQSPLEIVARIKQLLDTNTSRQRINYVNLNPVIMPVGEFRNEYAQTGDYTSHNIEYIGRSQVPPRGDLSIPNNKVALGFDEDQSVLADADNNSKVFDDAIMRKYFPEDPPNLPWTQKNYRFLGLRGPLVLSGWGFDTAGFPVPNSSGEPKGYGPDGAPLRIRDVYDQNPSSTTDGPILGKNQVPIQDAQGTPRWSDPYRETTFLKSWGLQSHLWPTGPVDLRWDESRRVWTSPKPYPNVYVELEHDLVAPYPSRGFLNAIDKDTPLPGGLRRTVFVRDSSESFGAPRGAKILCFYDEGSGFYEPLSRTPIVAFGVVVSSNNNNDPGYNNAIITADYAAGFNPTTGQPLAPVTITVNFSNPLGFTLISGLKGLFMFVKTQWVLMSVNSCQGG